MTTFYPDIVTQEGFCTYDLEVVCSKPTVLQQKLPMRSKKLSDFISTCDDIEDSVLETGHARLYVCLLSIQYKKRLLLRCIHHFESDLINNMDHMRILGTEPSSVVLSQRSNFKSWKEMSKTYQKQAEAKRDGVINLQNYDFRHFYHGKFRCSQTLRINWSRS